MKRALVLGGGGVIGVAWETGLLNGLFEAGFDPREADVIVGTSAGAIAGALIAAGVLPPVPGSEEARRHEADKLVMNPAATDATALAAIFGRWMKMNITTPAEAAEIGKLAATLHRGMEAQVIAYMARLLNLPAWPERRLLISAVDTQSGERRMFDRDGDVPLAHAVAASSAVPGIFPSVTIQGRLYMDGQVHSSTNVDALLPAVPELVLVAMPTNSVTSPVIGGHAERMLESELSALKGLGARVSVRTPLPEHGARLGTNLMDEARVPEAFAVGREVGQRWASELR